MSEFDDESAQKLKTVPHDRTEWPDAVMSNFDHSIDREALRAVVDGKHYASYPGWDFYGEVWFEEDELHCKVMCYGSHVDTISARSPEALMALVSDKYGWG